MKKIFLQKCTNAINKMLTDPRARFDYFTKKGYTKYMSDEKFLKKRYKLVMGHELNLEEPVSFNEKLQWLKLYDRRKEYIKMVDKYAVKEYVADLIGEEYIIPTLGVWENFDDIDFDLLPKRFVLKCTHDSGGLVICKDKEKLDIQDAKKKINRCLKRNFFWIGREWPYKNVKPRIIAEEYLEVPDKLVPEDYKVYCFGGKPKYIVIFHDRFDNSKELSETVYNTEWIPQNVSLDNHFMVSDIILPKPACLDAMLHCAEVLSKGIPQSRIDFYIVNDKIKFGEITLYTASGMQKMIPESLDEKLGEYISLPEKKCNR